MHTRGGCSQMTRETANCTLMVQPPLDRSTSQSRWTVWMVLGTEGPHRQDSEAGAGRKECPCGWDWKVPMFRSSRPPRECDRSCGVQNRCAWQRASQGAEMGLRMSGCYGCAISSQTPCHSHPHHMRPGERTSSGSPFAFTSDPKPAAGSSSPEEVTPFP